MTALSRAQFQLWGLASLIVAATAQAETHVDTNTTAARAAVLPCPTETAPVPSNPAKLTDIASLSEGKRYLKDILRKITRYEATKEAITTPNVADREYKDPETDGAHWIAEYRRAKTLDTVQRARFVQTLYKVLTPSEIAFLAATMTAYGEGATTLSSDKACDEDELDVSPEARLACLNDSTSSARMEGRIREALGYAKGHADTEAETVAHQLIDGSGSFFHSNTAKLPEMIRGLARAVETCDFDLGKDRQTLAFERAVKAYAKVTSEDDKPVAPAQTARGHAHDDAGLPDPKPIANQVIDFVTKPLRFGFRSIFSKKEHYLKTKESTEDALSRIVERTIEAREKLRAAFGPSRWQRIVDACRTGASLDNKSGDYDAILSVLRSKKPLSRKPEADLAGYSESDLFALTATASSEASSGPMDGYGKDGSWANPKIRVEMVATMQVLRNRGDRDFTGFTQPSLITTALNKEGDAFEGWSPGAHTACLIAGPLMNRGEGRTPLGGGPSDVTLWRSARAFLDLVDPNTQISYAATGPRGVKGYPFDRSTHYFAVGLDETNGKMPVFPRILLSDQKEPINVTFHHFGNRPLKKGQ